MLKKIIASKNITFETPFVQAFVNLVCEHEQSLLSQKAGTSFIKGAFLALGEAYRVDKNSLLLVLRGDVSKPESGAATSSIIARSKTSNNTLVTVDCDTCPGGKSTQVVKKQKAGRVIQIESPVVAEQSTPGTVDEPTGDGLAKIMAAIRKDLEGTDVNAISPDDPNTSKAFVKAALESGKTLSTPGFNLKTDAKSIKDVITLFEADVDRMMEYIKRNIKKRKPISDEDAAEPFVLAKIIFDNINGKPVTKKP